MTGLLGFASGYRAMEKCDALLMLGTDFPYQQFFPEKAKIVQVDLRGEQLGRRTPIDIGLVGGVRETAEALLPLIDDGRSDSFAKESVEHYRKTRKGLDELAVDDGNGRSTRSTSRGCSTSWRARMPCSPPMSEAPSSGRRGISR